MSEPGILATTAQGCVCSNGRAAFRAHAAGGEHCVFVRCCCSRRRCSGERSRRLLAALGPGAQLIAARPTSPHGLAPLLL
eukprot:6205072-Pleurochrysis_carterae.AAC.1